ncbi:hypothetical protein EHW67_14455 [Arenibacter aquaticus]|uniref:Sulfatase N-terminal domain-containing protein n=1 Tax=Arenibacter aquaticus TaxID=2489054 RepID=A0A430K1L3_9FLAO|nr:sulfatase [Arenibacter aquaticus]RTE52866.1 hypothetical protein EHW67_14455 [Arenibacter aquaticus]
MTSMVTLVAANMIRYRLRGILFTVVVLIGASVCKANLWEKDISRVMLSAAVPQHLSGTSPTTKGKEQSVKFIEKELRYYAPEAGSVSIVWKSGNHTLEEAMSWNDHTGRVKSFLQNSMLLEQDTFKIRLRIPLGSSFEYLFWISKNAQGHYQDHWDSHSGGRMVVSDASPILKEAQYVKRIDNKKSQIVARGWMLLLVLLGVYGLLWGLRNRMLITNSAVDKRGAIISMGLSLLLFHALARSEIVGVDPRYIFKSPSLILRIVKAGFEDFIYVIGLVLLFGILERWSRGIRLKNTVYGIFVFLVILSTLVAYTNISTVVYLGKPFNYQWFYYSDFLGSDDATNALQENLSLKILANLMAFCLSVFILSKILYLSYQLISVPRRVKYFVVPLSFMAVILLFNRAYRVEGTWSKGQSQNAVIAFVHSIFSSSTEASFFSAILPEGTSEFSPTEGTPIVNVGKPENKSHVKNVLFIVLESAGSVYLDGYGGSYQLTPNLNSYEDEAVLFTDIYAHAPGTNQSLVSILGSMYPYLSYKSLTNEAPDFDHPTMSSILKKVGYRTSFFTSADLNFLSSNKFLANRGLDHIEDYRRISCDEQFKQDIYEEGNGIDDICLSDRFFSWLDENSYQNFFSMIWTVQGHYPYFYAQEEVDFGVGDVYFNRYLNALKHNDELIGQVMRGLESRGLAETTLVVVTGDHGEAFGQHGQYGHGSSIYEENLRVPLYFINRSLFHGEQKKDIGGLKDLATTVFPIINKNIPEVWQGRDLLNTHFEEAFFFSPWSDYLFGYRKGNMKFIFNESQNMVEAYDLSTDFGEKVNLFSPDLKDEVKHARKRLGAWVQYQDKFVKGILRKNDD